MNEIKNYSINNLDSEVCGFIVEDNNDLKFLSIENKHPDKKNYFLISPIDYINIKSKYKILYFFHSHLCNSSFSDLDILHQKYHNINMLLYIIKEDCFLEMMCK